jgi:hypothetical protein
MEKFPGKYASVDEASSEESGINARAELYRMLGKHKVVPFIPTPMKPVKFVVCGDNLTEIWAMYVLLQMASDGIIERLELCDCGCGRWYIRERGIDRFATDACRVRSHQSDPLVKEKRRKEARKRYQLERKGKLTTGWKKAGRRRKKS